MPPKAGAVETALRAGAVGPHLQAKEAEAIHW